MESPKNENAAESVDFEILDQPGKFAMIDKNEISVDHRYQREKISDITVNAILNAFCWAAFGVLILARRKNGTLWCVDGQTRLSAAALIDSIQKVPCMIYDLANVADESKIFLAIQTGRKPVAAWDKYRAKLTAKDPAAIWCKRLISADGYDASHSQNGKRFCSIDTLQRAYARNPELAKEAWDACVQVAAGGEIRGDVFSAVFYLAEFLPKTASCGIADLVSQLKHAGLTKITERMFHARNFHGKSGAKVHASGIVSLINSGRKSNLLPDPMSTAA